MYKINGTDLFTACGFLADSSRESSNSLERPPDPAEVFSHAWDNGTVDYDLTTVPGKKARIFKLTGSILASSEADYIAKKIAFDSLIRAPKSTIYNDETGITVLGKLSKVSNWERLTPIKGSDLIATRVSVEFNELLGIRYPISGIYYGTSTSVPVTTADVQALTATAFTNTVTLQTGTTNRILTIAIQADKSITSVTDLDNPIFPAVTYPLQGTVTIGAITYNIYSLILGSAYSTNHRHKFIIA